MIKKLLKRWYRIYILGLPLGIVFALEVAEEFYRNYKCPHGYEDSDKCPDCRH